MSRVGSPPPSVIKVVFFHILLPWLSLEEEVEGKRISVIWHLKGNWSASFLQSLIEWCWLCNWVLGLGIGWKSLANMPCSHYISNEAQTSPEADNLIVPLINWSDILGERGESPEPSNESSFDDLVCHLLEGILEGLSA